MSAETITDLVVRHADANIRQALERHRAKFEELNGETDLTRYYTSMRPLDEQLWLLDVYPQKYWTGLPLFVQDFIHQLVCSHKRAGSLDNLPDHWLRAYQNGALVMNR